MKKYLIILFVPTLIGVISCKNKNIQTKNNHSSMSDLAHYIAVIAATCLSKEATDDAKVYRLKFQINSDTRSFYTYKDSHLFKMFKEDETLDLNYFRRSTSIATYQDWATLANNNYNPPGDQGIRGLSQPDKKGEYGCVPRLIYSTNYDLIKYDHSESGYYRVLLNNAIHDDRNEEHIIPLLREQFFITNQNGINKLNEYLDTYNENIEIGTNTENIDSIFVYNANTYLGFIKKDQ